MTSRKPIRTEKPVGPRGFTRWLHPVMTGYLMICCDCGLAHELDFKAYARGPTRKNGHFKATLLPRTKYGVMFRARRSPGHSRKSA